jgi:hypothetical protein
MSSSPDNDDAPRASPAMSKIIPGAMSAIEMGQETRSSVSPSLPCQGNSGGGEGGGNVDAAVVGRCSTGTSFR